MTKLSSILMLRIGHIYGDRNNYLSEERQIWNGL